MQARRLLASLGLAVGLADASLCQPAPAKPTFDVVSVRFIPDGSPFTPGFSLNPRRANGQFSWTTTLGFLSRYAYRLPGWRITWINSEWAEQSFYRIAATMDAATSEDDVRLMLQQVLTDRFQMVTRKETKELPGYALVTAKNGPKLAVAANEGEFPPMPQYLASKSPAAFEGQIFTSAEGPGASAITGRGVPLSKLTDALSEALGVFVVDRTALNGRYYFGFRFADYNRPVPAVDAPSIFSALQDEHGLKLESQKGPVEVLIITHVEKIPTEN
jgi:uncharacterized protein (TIGR03435 family)